MAQNYRLSINSHNSIYTNIPINQVGYDRKVNVYYSLPQAGTNADTGILLIISGFGGEANSNVYKQMREEFADKYNLVTIQCNYFGYEFMQSLTDTNSLLAKITKPLLSNYIEKEDLEIIFPNNQLSINELSKYKKKSVTIKLPVNLSSENVSNFNDMGFMQAIDNINAVLYILNFLYENNLPFNTKKILSYGFSHGAYLAYLCNAFAPKLFSLIIDNSAWLYPVYLLTTRLFWAKITDYIRLCFSFEYFACKNSNLKVIYDKDILSLDYLYSKFNNKCEIIAYHGFDDELIHAIKKRAFCNKLNYCNYNEIDEYKLDNNIFKSTTHGLGADFKKLFHLTMENLDFNFDKSNELEFVEEVVFKTDKATYKIDYQNIFPKIHIY